MKNQFIKSESKEHAVKIVEYFKSKGAKVSFTNNCFAYEAGYHYGESGGEIGHYKGDIPQFEIERENIEIITLPSDNNKPKRGDWVLVRDQEITDWYKRIFITEIEGTIAPFICVEVGHEKPYKDGEKYRITTWNHMKPIEEPEIIEVTIEEIAKLKGVTPEQIRIKDEPKV